MQKRDLIFFPREPRKVFPNSRGLYFIFSSTPFHLHTFSPSHLVVFTASLPPSHIHICLSSPFLIFTSCPFTHHLIFTSAPLHICCSSHLFILTPSHHHTCAHTLSSSDLPSVSVSTSLSSLFRPSVVPVRSHETRTLANEMRISRQKLR